MSIALITPPAAEPITLAEAKLQLGFGPMQDSDRAASQILNDKLRAFIIAARQDCENYTASVYVTQRWLLQLDSFPGIDTRYDKDGSPAITLPKIPFQSLDWFKYVDTSGTVQTLARDTTYGVAAAQYGYEVNNGSETQATRLCHPWARPWPPARMVSNAISIQFRCGFGGPLTVSMTSGSAQLTVANGITFNGILGERQDEILDLLVRQKAQAAGRARRVVAHVDEAAGLAADGHCGRRGRQPLVERAALVDLEMAEADPVERGRVDEPRHGGVDVGEELSHAGVVEQGRSSRTRNWAKPRSPAAT